MLYHISKTAGLKMLEPRISTHGKPYVYAVENLVTGLLFGAPHDDFDFLIRQENGTAVVMECYPGAFQSVFQGKACWIYEVSEDSFLRGMTTWSPELVSEKEVAVDREIPVIDLYARLLQEEKDGNLVIRRFEDTKAYKQAVSEHIVDRLIRFDMVYADSEKLQKHYGPLIRELRKVMDGHLL